MKLLKLLAPLALALLALAPMAKGQEAVRAAVCNPAKVFEQLDERKAASDRMQADREKLKAEAARRQAEIKDLEQQRNDLKPGTPQHNEKTQLLMARVIEFEVWARIQDAELARREKEMVKQLFDKIITACKVVAEQKKLDLILAERKPEIPDLADPKLTADQVRMLLNQNDVLYKNDKADVTQAVILQLNQDYARGR
jgi:Skp family chaperone for outer membrane proteins